MLKRSFTTVLMGSQALGLGVLLGSSALAQSGEVVEGNTTVVETPLDNTAVVPGMAAEPGTPVGAVSRPDYPLLEQLDNDEAIAQSLISQGFTDIHILREGAIMTVHAERDGQPTELVYSIANGSLISVDGVELRAEPDTTSNGETAAAASDDASDGNDGTNDGSDEDSGSDPGADDGSDDGDSNDGSDDGSDSSDGADGSDGGDGGSDGGSDGDGSDGGDSGEGNG